MIIHSYSKFEKKIFILKSFLRTQYNNIYLYFSYNLKIVNKVQNRFYEHYKYADLKKCIQHPIVKHNL